MRERRLKRSNCKRCKKRERCARPFSNLEETLEYSTPTTASDARETGSPAPESKLRLTREREMNEILTKRVTTRSDSNEEDIVGTIMVTVGH